jgi:hypothetical protein
LKLAFNVTGNNSFRGFSGSPGAIYAITSNQFYVLSSTGTVIAATSTTTPILNATLTAGQATFPFTGTGYNNTLSFGTLSPSTDTNGNTVTIIETNLAQITVTYASSSSLGKSYFFGLTVGGGDFPNAINFLTSNATYSFTGAASNWQWAIPRQLTNGVVYSVTLTGLAANNAIPSIAYSPTQVIYVDGTSSLGFPISTYVSQNPGISAVSPNATTVANVAGFFVVEVPGTRQFYVSAFNNGFSWPALSFAYCASGSDNLLAVDELLGNLVLFRQIGSEFWQNQGLSPQPFAPILSAANEYGLAAKWSRGHIDQSIIYLAQSPEGNVQFVRIINSYAPQVISDEDIDDIINDFSVVSDAEALVYDDGHHKIYQCTFPTENRSFIYDCSTGIWSEVQTGTSLVPSRHQARFSAYCGGVRFLSDYQNGNVYTVEEHQYTDNGVTIVREVITRHISQQFNRFRPSQLYLDMKVGDAPQGSDPQVMLQYSKDNAQTWSGERWASLGATGKYLTRVKWRRFGSTRDATFKIRMTDPVDFVITEGAMKLNERQPAERQA